MVMLLMAEDSFSYRGHDINIALKFDPANEVFIANAKVKMFSDDMGHYNFSSTLTSRDNQDAISKTINIVHAVIDSHICEHCTQFSEPRSCSYKNVKIDRLPGFPWDCFNLDDYSLQSFMSRCQNFLQ